MTAAPTVLGWDTFVQQSMALEVAGIDTPADAPFEVLDALPQAELPRMHDVPHDATMTAVLMPDALGAEELAAATLMPSADEGGRDLVYACTVRTNEQGQFEQRLWLVGMGSLRQRRDADGSVCVRLHWRGQEWPVLLMERALADALIALADTLDAKAPGIGAALRLGALDAVREAKQRPSVMREVLTVAYNTLVRARLGVTPGLRSPAHQALARRMWARCIATVQARADAETAHSVRMLPSVTAQVSPLFPPGRFTDEVRRRVKRGLLIDVGSRVMTASNRVRPADVRVSLHIPEGVSRARYAKIVDVEGTLFPHVCPDDDLQAGMIDVLAQRLMGRNLMPSLAYVCVIHERGGVELVDGEFGVDVRTEVMDLVGCPNRTANAVQRQRYGDIGYVMRHWQFRVEPHSTGGGKGRPKRRPERVPLLVETALEMDSNRAIRVNVNPEVLEGGRMMPVPRALFAITDDMDADGSLRIASVGIVSRLVLSAADHGRLRRGESLVKVLMRMGLLDKLQDKHRERGAAAAQAWLDGMLDRLRGIGPANIIGDTHVEWGKGSEWLKRARLHYGTEQPGWLARKRPPALPPASGSSVVIGV
jgi:hypothetical protein